MKFASLESALLQAEYLSRAGSLRLKCLIDQHVEYGGEFGCFVDLLPDAYAGDVTDSLRPGSPGDGLLGLSRSWQLIVPFALDGDAFGRVDREP